jgi:hypothetical protein
MAFNPIDIRSQKIQLSAVSYQLSASLRYEAACSELRAAG